MKKFWYISWIIIVIVWFIEFLLWLFYWNTITWMMWYISMLLWSIAIWLNTEDEVKNIKDEEDNVVCTPYYTWRECKHCHIVRPLNWEKCDCKKTFK